MSEDRTASITCPVCGSSARVRYEWSDDAAYSHGRILEYSCPRGCQVDELTLRELVGVP